MSYKSIATENNVTNDKGKVSAMVVQNAFEGAAHSHVKSVRKASDNLIVATHRAVLAICKKLGPQFKKTSQEEILRQAAATLTREASKDNTTRKTKDARGRATTIDRAAGKATILLYEFGFTKESDVDRLIERGPSRVVADCELLQGARESLKLAKLSGLVGKTKTELDLNMPELSKLVRSLLGKVDSRAHAIRRVVGRILEVDSVDNDLLTKFEGATKQAIAQEKQITKADVLDWKEAEIALTPKEAKRVKELEAELGKASRREQSLKDRVSAKDKKIEAIQEQVRELRTKDKAKGKVDDNPPQATQRAASAVDKSVIKKIDALMTSGMNAKSAINSAIKELSATDKGKVNIPYVTAQVAGIRNNATMNQ